MTISTRIAIAFPIAALSLSMALGLTAVAQDKMGRTTA